MARKVEVAIVANASQYERTLRTSAVQAKGFERELSTIGRGAAAGSGAFQKFGRSLAFASGGFLAFEGFTATLEATISAARGAEVANRSLAAQMKASGESFDQNKDRIEEVAKSYGRFGFADEAVIQSMTVLERATGSIDKAISLQGVTADLARAKNLDLAAAAAVVGKVFGGQETALRRAVPGLSKHAHGLALIAEASRKLAGQARAATTPEERFQATLHNTEVTVGTLLLPAMGKLLDAGTAAAAAAGVWAAKWNTAGTTANDVKGNLDDLAAAMRGVGNATDWVVGKVGGWSKVFSVAKGVFLQATELSGVIGAVHLAKKLFPGDPAARAPSGAADAAAKAAHGIAASGSGSDAAVAAAVAKKGASASQKNQWFDAIINRDLGRVQDISSLRGQLARLQQISGLVQQRLKATKDITRKLSLEDQLLEIARQQKDVRDQITQNQVDAAQTAQDNAQKAQDAMQAAKDEALAWADFAEERAAATKTLKDDLKAAKAKLALLTQQAGVGKKTAEQAQAIWEQQQKVNEIAKQMKGASSSDGFRSLTTSQVLAAVGPLGRAQRQRVLGLFATLGPRGTAPTSTGQFGSAGGVTITGPVHIHGVQNTKQMEAELAKRAKARSHVRRGAR